MDPEIHSLTGAYACDALDAAERAAFEHHLAVCRTCAQEVAELRETVAHLAMAAAEPPPADLRMSVDAAIGRVRQLPPLPTAGPVARRVGWFHRNFTASLGWGVAAAMSVVIAVLGVRISDQQHQIASADRRTSAITALLTAPDARAGSGPVRTGGDAMVLVSRSRDEAAITMSGLTAPSDGTAYQLWMIGADGIRSGGILPTNAQGTAGFVVAHGLGDAQTIGLTLEPSQGSAQPTTTPILLLPMPV